LARSAAQGTQHRASMGPVGSGLGRSAGYVQPPRTGIRRAGEQAAGGLPLERTGVLVRWDRRPSRYLAIAEDVACPVGGGSSVPRPARWRIVAVVPAVLLAFGVVLALADSGPNTSFSVGLIAREFLFESKEVTAGTGEIAFLVKNQGAI